MAVVSTPSGRMTAHEQLRLAAVLDAMPDFDPGAVLAEETEAHRMLYSGRRGARCVTPTRISGGARGWPCGSCPVGDCRSCRQGRSCERHWTFLLAAEARRIFVQCPRCWTRCWHDTGFGVGDRPESLNDPLILPGVA